MNDDKKPTICIAGASGYIGLELVRELISYNINIKVLTRNNFYPIKNVDVYKADISDSKTDLNNFFQDCDIFINCIGESIDEDLMYLVNVETTKNLLKYSFSHIKHWIQLSSIAVYGNKLSGVITENSIKSPKNIYQQTKLDCEKLIIKDSLNNKFNYTIIRPSKVIGGNKSDPSFIQLVKYIKKGLFFYIGSKGSSFNYIYYKNIIDVIILCFNNQSAYNKCFNISDHIKLEKAVSIISTFLKKKNTHIRIPSNIAKLIVNLVSLLITLPLSNEKIDGLTTKCIFSQELLNKSLGYENKIKLNEAIIKSIKKIRF